VIRQRRILSQMRENPGQASEMSEGARHVSDAPHGYLTTAIVV
jgi:hypothetical protein